MTAEALIVLAEAAYSDCKIGKISAFVPGICICLTVFEWMAMCITGKSIVIYVLGIIPSVILYFIARFSKEAIGYGDVLLILLLGIKTGIVIVTKVLIYSFLLAALVGVILMICKIRNKKDRICFVPFLVGSFTIELSLLMPLILGVLLILIFTGFYMHDKVIIERACYGAILQNKDYGLGKCEESCREIFNKELKGRLIAKWDIEEDVIWDEAAYTLTISATSKMHICEGLVWELVPKSMFSYNTVYSSRLLYGDEYLREYVCKNKK